MMNAQAERHLSKAEGYLTKGDGFYRKAAEEIIAAQESDSTLSNREIGERFGRSETWVRDIVKWVTSSQTSATPFSNTGRPHQDRSAAKKVLTEAPLEQVEQILSELPKERVQAIGAAAGNEYLKAREEYDWQEAHKTPAERKDAQAAKGAITEAGRRATAGFTSLGIAGHLEQATEELRELVADGSVTAASIEPIEEALSAFVDEYHVARAMAGLESDLEEAAR